MAKTGYERIIEALDKYLDNNGARKDIVADFNDYAKETGGIRLRTTNDSLCSETVIAAFYRAGYIDLIGRGCTGCSSLKSNAKKLGTWHSGSSGIKAGDIVLYGGNTPNHTEFAVDDKYNISGQYKDGGVHKRRRGGRAIHGYIRPKYPATTKEGNAMTLYKVQSGAFKSAVLAAAAAAAARKKIDKYLKKIKSKDSVSVGIIQSGGYYKVQEGAFASKDNAARRRDLVRDAGVYAVVIETHTQDTASPQVEPVAEKKPVILHPRIVVWPIWFFEKNENEYGDCTAILEYAEDGKTVAHCILIDCAKGSAAPVIISKLKKAGVTKIDAIVISHGHGDHYGSLSAIVKAFPVAAIYLPDYTELARYQAKYAKALRRQAAKVKSSRFLKAGDSFKIGHIACECLFICPAGRLKEHDSHHFVNNESMAIMLTLDDTWKFFSAGDLQNEGNRILLSAGINIKAHIYKFQWHGDRNAILHDLMKAVRPVVAYSNYHHKERSGRSSTRKVAEAAGAVVARNWENGDIYIECQGSTMKLSCSKKNLSKTFKL